MKEKLQSIKEEALKAIESADVPEKLNDVRVRFLGKKGELTAVLKGMKDVAPEERPKVGQLVNETRAAIEEVMEDTRRKMERAIREEKMKQEVIDVTLPSKKNMVGHRHPNTIALEEVEQICSRIAIIDHGRVLATGTKEELKSMIKTGETITIQAVALDEKHLSQIRELPHVFDISYEEQTLKIRLSGAKHNLVRVLHYMEEQDISFGRVFSELPTLNDVFLEITGTELRD